MVYVIAILVVVLVGGITYYHINTKPAEPVTRCGKKCKDAANCAEQWGDECCCVIDPPPALPARKFTIAQLQQAKDAMDKSKGTPPVFYCPECQDKNTPATCACMWP